jgi:hypothetical protein
MRSLFIIQIMPALTKNGTKFPLASLNYRNTGCRSLVVVLSLSKREVVSSSPARDGHVKPKTVKIGSDCSFVKSTVFRSENHGSFGYDLEKGDPVSQ